MDITLLKTSTALSLARSSPTANRVATAQTGLPPRRPVGSWRWAKTTARQLGVMMSSSLMAGPSSIRSRGTPPPGRIARCLPRAPAPSPWLTRTSTTTRPMPSSTRRFPLRPSTSRVRVPTSYCWSTTQAGVKSRNAARFQSPTTEPHRLCCWNSTRTRRLPTTTRSSWS